MSWRRWKLGAVIAVGCGILSGLAGLAAGMSWQAFVAVLATSLVTHFLSFLKDHPYEQVSFDDSNPRAFVKDEVVNKVGLWLAAAFIVFFVAGCAHLKPGADPIVVRTEQTETMSRATFTAFLQLDDANRAFVRTNAPAAHQFAEWLRTPQVQGDPSSRRWIVMVRDLDQVKLDYIAGRQGSNALVMAIATVGSTVRKAEDFIAAEQAVTKGQ